MFFISCNTILISAYKLPNVFGCFISRTALLFEHSDVVVLAALGVLFHSGGTGPSKVNLAKISLLYLQMKLTKYNVDFGNCCFISILFS